jgi:hypothetical protein
VISLRFKILLILLFLIAACLNNDMQNNTEKHDASAKKLIEEETNKEEIIEQGQFNAGETNTEIVEPKLIMFHNGQGSMCLRQVEFLDEIKKEYPDLITEEHLTYEIGTSELLSGMISQYEKSQGKSDIFGYYPITFINNHAYSGFDNLVKESLIKDIKEVTK